MTEINPAWLRTAPPIVAIVLAMILREAHASLLIGVFCGAMILTHGNPVTAGHDLLNQHIAGQLTNNEHAQVIMFTLCLGAMIGVMSRSQGTSALVRHMTRFATTRNRGQLLIWAMGLVVFFDDYANTMLVGSSTRSMADRLRISREKLAFLIDSTAAPVAGIAIVSTWVGFEIEQIQAGFEAAGVTCNPKTVFLQSLPYRFYPILLLGFVMLLAATGRDFGRMLGVERRILTLRSNPTTDLSDGPATDNETPGRIINAVVPIAILLLCVGYGFARDVDSYELLLVSSCIASFVAVLTAVVTRALTFRACSEAWVDGAATMFPAIVILVLAWSIAGICDADHLNTAGFLVETFGSHQHIALIPAIAFLLSAVVSFATGSSFATMGLLMPLSISLACRLLAADADTAGPLSPDHPVLLATIGAVLAGSIFGDHCSPISDTTILSSAAAGCDHVSHVNTQMPYALTVGAIALIVGYLPAGFGYSPAITLPIGLLLAAVIVFAVGRNSENPQTTACTTSSDRSSSSDPHGRAAENTLPD